MMTLERGICILPPEEARRIAAGEVISRPADLVREFLDNAIDAGSSLIEVSIEQGGISLTEVSDDGSGMGREDIELCCQSHATSKIRSLDDLKTIGTLGFRGEALAAAQAVSRLEILSSRDGKEAWKYKAGPDASPSSSPSYSIEQSRRVKGTSIRSLGLFDNIPARKRFLKREGSEEAACRQIFNEKALAFPGLTFRFMADGALKSFLPPVSSHKERFKQIYFFNSAEGAFLHEITSAGEGFSVSVVAGGPEIYRRDRRLQFVFANSRRIGDFALLQAMEYGLDGWFPNGTHPAGAVFVTIDPALADFNIHPAKREVRFADAGAIHHAVSSALKNLVSVTFSRNLTTNHTNSYFLHEQEQKETGNQEFVSVRGEKIAGKALGELASEALEPSYAAEGSVPYSSGGTRYLGQLFGLFILIEKNSKLFIIDQHAAHERILYNRFVSNPVPKQDLLVAIPFTTESPGEDDFLEEKREELARLGVIIRKEGQEWLIEALPSAWKLSDSKTVEEILNLKNSRGNIAESWAATLSCHAAVKDGDYLDEKTALALAEEALALSVPHCPHGRPIWFEISRDDLLRAVRRKES